MYQEYKKHYMLGSSVICHESGGMNGV